MNKIVSAFVMAGAGVAAASLLAAWRRNQLAAKAQEREEAIHRWEDDGGGTVPGRAGGVPAP